MTTSTSLPRTARRRRTAQRSASAFVARARSLPVYLTQPEFEALLAAASSVVARTLMLVQSRAGPRISEALDLEAWDVALHGDQLALTVGEAKGRRTRAVPLHTELADALRLYLEYHPRRTCRLSELHRSTAYRQVKDALAPARRMGVII